MSVIAIRAALGWLGPGRLVEEPLVVLDGTTVAFAEAAAELGVVADDASTPERLDGSPLPPEPDEELRFDGFVMPGVVDRHVHIGLSDTAVVLAGGVTAVRDLGWPADAIFSLVEASDGPAFNGPLIRASGPIITCVGGYPSRSGWAPEGTAIEVSSAHAAAAAARWLLRAGASIVKVALNAEAGPTLSDEQLLAVCDVAHEADVRVTAHAQGFGQAVRAVGAGVDEFAHCPWTEPLPDQLVRSMVARGIRVVSTLDIHSYGRATRDLNVAVDNLARFAAEGGEIAYGTDLGNGPIPPGIHAGEAAHLGAAGLDVEGILRAMTFRPLSRGEPADLVGLGRSPFDSLDALADVRLVFHGGRRVR